MLAVGAGWSQPRAAPASRGDPQAPQQLREEQGSLPDFHPSCSVFTSPLAAGWLGRRTEPPHPAEGEMFTTQPLSSAHPPRDTQTRRGKPRWGELPGSTAVLLHHLQKVTARMLPSPAAPSPRWAARKVTSPLPKPHHRLPCSFPAAREGCHPFPSHLFLPNFFFQKQLTLFFEEQQMSGTLPVPFMMLNLLPRFAIAILMMNTPVALMHLECWH